MTKVRAKQPQKENVSLVVSSLREGVVTSVKPQENILFLKSFFFFFLDLEQNEANGGKLKRWMMKEAERRQQRVLELKGCFSVCLHVWFEIQRQQPGRQARVRTMTQQFLSVRPLCNELNEHCRRAFRLQRSLRHRRAR